MASTEMNFGPDWLRALSDGVSKNASTTNSSSNSINNVTMASTISKSNVKYRYSSEEILSCYNRNSIYIPKDLMEHDEVFVDTAQPPMAFTEQMPTEQELFNHCAKYDHYAKKAMKDSTDPNERVNDYLEQDIIASKSNKIKCNSPGGDLFARVLSVDRKSNGIFSERGNGHPLRPGRGGSISERGSRSGIRAPPNGMVVRLSSLDESSSAARSQSSTITSPSLVLSKKSGLQRSSTESSASSAMLTNMFLPAWRTNSTSSSNVSTNSNNNVATSANSTNTETKSEWKSNSDSSKNWRVDCGPSSGGGAKTNSFSYKSNKDGKKDIFSSIDNDESSSSANGSHHDSQSRDYGQRNKRNLNSNKTLRTFVRDARFNIDQLDLFKPLKPSVDSLDFLEIERDLFGGRSGASSSTYGYNSYKYNDLFASSGGSGNGRGKSGPGSGMSRYSRDRNGGDYHNDKWNNHSKSSYSSNDRDGRHNYRSQHQHNYHRSNSHNNQNDFDDYDKMGSDDDDYRRNSLPEWSLDDSGGVDVTRVGTFDASGAFHEAPINDDDQNDEDGDENSKSNDNKTNKLANSSKQQSASRSDKEEQSKEESTNKHGEKKKETTAKESNQVEEKEVSSKKSSATEGEQSIQNQSKKAEKSLPNYFNDSCISHAGLVQSSSEVPKEEKNQRENDSRNSAISKFDNTAEDETTMLSNQLSKLLKEDSHASNEMNSSHATGTHSELSSASQNNNSNNMTQFYSEAFQQQQNASESIPSSQQSMNSSDASLFQTQLISRLLNPTANNEPSLPPMDLLSERLLSAGNLGNKQAAMSLLNDNFNFNFGSIAPLSTSVGTETNSNSQPLFSNLSGQALRQLKTFSSLESSLGLGLDPSEQLNNTRLALNILQQQSQMQKRQDEKADPVLSNSLKQTQPFDSEASNKWFYRDPQGNIQGPFNANEMYEWYASGYFSMDLLVRRACDENFSKLGDLYQSFGGVPFLSMNSPPGAVPVSFTAGSDSGPGNAATLFSPPVMGSNQSLHNSASQPTSHQPLQSGLTGPIVPPASSRFMPSQPPNNTFGSMLDDLAQSSNSLSQLNSTLFGNNGANLKDAQSLASNMNMLNMLQRQQQQQPQLQAQSHPLQPTNQHAVPQNQMGPQSSASFDAQSQHQLRLILNQLMKNERFQHMTNAQQEQIVLQRLRQLNAMASSNNGGNNAPIRDTPKSDPFYGSSICRNEMESFSKSKSEEMAQQQQQQQQKKMSLEEQLQPSLQQQQQLAGAVSKNQVLSTNHQFDIQSHFNQSTQATPPSGVGPQGPNSNSDQLVMPPSSSVAQQFATGDQPSQEKPNPLQILQSALAAAAASGTSQAPPPGTISAWETIVPRALSLSAVEELQRREAEERYRLQQQDQQKAQGYSENDLIQFDTKSEDENKQQQTNKDQSEHQQQKKRQKTKQDATAKPQQQQTQQPIGKQGMLDTKSQVEAMEMAKSQARIEQQTEVASSTASSVPQLSKKSVWGNPSIVQQETTAVSQPLSIAEIQKLQEAKEREEEEIRQRAIQEHMASLMSGKAGNAAPAVPLKWATPQWQDQSAKVKTLAEIQEEETAKLNAIRQQEELEARRRITPNATMTPLSAIVAKNASGTGSMAGGASVWNKSSAQLFSGSQQAIKSNSGGIWDEEDVPIGTTNSAVSPSSSSQATSAAAAVSTYKNVVNNSNPSTGVKTKVDSALLKQKLKTNPKNVKKIEESHLLKLSVESPDELIRHSIDVLNKSFESIDAQGFMSIVKDLGTPNEVVECVQHYLGNNQSAMYFAKFFISKKSYLFNKSKQEALANRDNVEKSAKTAQNKSAQNRSGGVWSNNNDEEDDGSVGSRQNASSYKSALNQATVGVTKSTKGETSGKNSSSTFQTKKSTNTASVVQSLQQPSKPKIVDDVNIMNAPVETMEEFDKWCIDVLKQNFELTIDPDTFVSFLKFIDSPYEINEYVQTYLGVNKPSRDFSKNFISKRSYLRNKEKQKQYEDMCGPAPAITPSMNKVDTNDNNGFVVVSSSNKKKRKGRNNQQNNNTNNNTNSQHD